MRILLCAALLAVSFVQGHAGKKFYEGGSFNSYSYDSYSGQIPYKVLYRGEEYDERLYAGKYYACTNYTAEYDQGKKFSAYYRLLDYMSGENFGEYIVEVTAPILTQFKFGDDFPFRRMCFYISEEYQAEPPKPKSDYVYLKQFKNVEIAVRRFTGYPKTYEFYKNEAENLKASLIKDEKFSEYDQEYYYSACYQPPWKYYNRKNEVFFKKPYYAKKEASATKEFERKPAADEVDPKPAVPVVEKPKPKSKAAHMHHS
jgi:hypothetical protein